jgi:hypothetical protein
MSGKMSILKLAYEPLHYNKLDFSSSFMFILTMQYQLEILNSEEWQCDYECNIWGSHNSVYEEFYFLGYNSV